MGTLTICKIITLGCLMVMIEAQNASSPMDILNSMKTSVEAAGAGGLKLGPMGLFGDLSGQFGVKVNKEETSATKGVISSKERRGRFVSILTRNADTKSKSFIGKNGKMISQKDEKSCYGRRGYGGPIIIPIIVTTTAATTTTTAANSG